MDIDYLLVMLPIIVFLGISGLVLVIWQYGNFRNKKDNSASLSVDDGENVKPTFPYSNTGHQAPLFCESYHTKMTTEKELRTSPLETLIILQLIASEERPYKGYELIQTLSSTGFHYGAMNIFHYHVNQDKKKERLFSLASAVEPGTFDLNHIGEIYAPGLCLFMSLATTKNALNTFEIMLEIAQLLLQDLGGTLCDQQRKPLTSTSLTHYRSQLHAYA
jgi:cell division protein ZipA